MGAARDALTERPGGELLQGSRGEVTLAFDVLHALPLWTTESNQKPQLTQDIQHLAKPMAPTMCEYEVKWMCSLHILQTGQTLTTQLTSPVR